ncbi:MAG: UDP-glucose/GDP-mannose dehydrogenase family protein [Acidobacteriota bacterium]
MESSRPYFPLEKKISVLGLGHVGLPTAMGLAEPGWEVVGADSDPSKVEQIQHGDSPFYEPGIQEHLHRHLERGTFLPTAAVDDAIRAAQVLFLCVGTPQRDNGQADLSQVEGLARDIARNLNGYKLIIEKSTVPAITAQWVKRTILRYMGCNGVHPEDGDNGTFQHLAKSTTAPSVPIFDVASNPEFLHEGKAIQNFFHPDRIVCGVETERARRILESIYRPLGCPIVMTDLTTAELIKHAANALLCTKISFINMLADLCEAMGADVSSLSEGIGSDHRIGSEILRAGIGFGGYCFPKDLKASIYLAEEHGVDFSLLKQVERVNEQRIEAFLKKVQQALWVIKGKNIGILGLAFKAGTDDIREAPSLKVIRSLLEEGVTLRLYDPSAMPNVRKVLPEQKGSISYCESAYDAARGADALLALIEWDEFRELDPVCLRNRMAVPTVVDGRNLFDPLTMQHSEFEYHSVGRNVVGLPFSFEESPELIPQSSLRVGAAQ